MTTLFKTAWSIVADGTLFKGAFVVVADSDQDAIEKTKALLGREGNAASITVKLSGEGSVELGRSEYPAEKPSGISAPHVESPFSHSVVDRFVYDAAARANVIATSEKDAVRKLAHAMLGKDVPSVKFMRTKAQNPEPIGEMSQYEKHLLEKQFHSVRVSST